jgi:hypothetical protein
MILFISPYTFWRVRKLYDFEKKFLRTLGDARILRRYITKTMYKKDRTIYNFERRESIIENHMVGGRTMHSCTEILVHISALQYNRKGISYM